MYLKKKATVLISTVIILSLMSILGGFMFKMMQNNKELGSLYRFDKDIYDLDKNEEEMLNEFMEELNEDIGEKLRNQNKENNSEGEINEKSIDNDVVLNQEEFESKAIKDKSDKEDIFSGDFVKKIEDNILEYHKNNNKLYLITNKDNKINRKREIIYILRGEKIILVPTYKFENNFE